MFYFGVGTIGRFAIGFILLTELTPKKHQVMFGALYVISDSVATLYVTFILRYISNNIQTVLWIAFSCNFIALITGIIIPESPKWLAEKGKSKLAMKSIARIAKINGVSDFDTAYDLKKDVPD